MNGKIKVLDKEISELNSRQEQLLNPDEELNVFIDKLIEHTSEIKNLQLENEYYLRLSVIKSDVKAKEQDLDEIKEKIVKDIEKEINSKIKEVNDLVHEDKRSAPKLDLTYTSYEYKISNNTGTGKAYSNLLIFDLAVLLLTRLPLSFMILSCLKTLKKKQ